MEMLMRDDWTKRSGAGAGRRSPAQWACQAVAGEPLPAREARAESPPGSLYRRAGAFALACLVYGLPGNALEFGTDEVGGSIDTTISHGVTFRVGERDEVLIKKDVNGDDGNLNYDRGIVSNTTKFTSDVEIESGNFGAFFRATGFVDFENSRGGRKLDSEAKDRLAEDVEVLDLYATAAFDVGDAPLDVRIGRHVLNWGESTFVLNGINAINPIDVGRVRLPGSELREALVPVSMISGSLAPTDELEIEGFYQFEWEKTEIDPPGSYFSTIDYVGAGGDRVEIDLSSDPRFATIKPNDEDEFLFVRRGLDRTPSDSGQFGLAIRTFAEDFGNTELGFYFMNLHSRTPLAAAHSGTGGGIEAGLKAAQAAGQIAIGEFVIGTNPQAAAAGALMSAMGGAAGAQAALRHPDGAAAGAQAAARTPAGGAAFASALAAGASQTDAARAAIEAAPEMAGPAAIAAVPEVAGPAAIRAAPTVAAAAAALAHPAGGPAGATAALMSPAGGEAGARAALMDPIGGAAGAQAALGHPDGAAAGAQAAIQTPAGGAAFASALAAGASQTDAARAAIEAAPEVAGPAAIAAVPQVAGPAAIAAVPEVAGPAAVAAAPEIAGPAAVAAVPGAIQATVAPAGAAAIHRYAQGVPCDEHVPCDEGDEDVFCYEGGRCYKGGASYYVEYPEDIEIWGASFNTQVGTSGWALQGEYSFRRDAPLQISDEKILGDGLDPIFKALGCPPGDKYCVPSIMASLPPGGGPVRGFIRRNVSQAQITGTRVFGPALGADAVVFLTEAAVTHVHGMPPKDEVPLDGPGGSTADATSVGYRMATRFDYHNAIGPVNVFPYVQFQHDVNGTSPAGLPFVEGRVALTLGMSADYLSRWKADLSYTAFAGAGRRNLLNDRDFISASIAYSF